MLQATFKNTESQQILCKESSFSSIPVMFWIFPSPNTPDSNEQVVIQAVAELDDEPTTRCVGFGQD